MKLNIKKIKTTPEKFGFNFCQYGKLTDSVQKWVDHWGFKTEEAGPFTNIIIGDAQPDDIFQMPDTWEYIDGFSPNLNKQLHVGHLSNLVLAKSFQKLGMGKKFIAILGDTLSTGDTTKEDALKLYKEHCSNFDYDIDEIFYASEMTIKNESLLVNGENDYEGTKIFNLGDDGNVVGLKSDGSTTYFYQDVALAQHLGKSTLYMTGNEQSGHFKNLKSLCPYTDHLGLGLVMLDGKKMSSSDGNVIYLQDFIDDLMKIFNNDIKLVYNIMAGQILNSKPGQTKSIDSKLISNPKLSLGLYLSYTMAHIKSCGVTTKPISQYKSQKLQFAHIKSICSLSPNVLFKELVDHCKEINKLYETHYIKDNPENIEIFSNLISDLELGMFNLGLFPVDTV
jgi:arginyl-tRNA synthetase